MKQIIALSLMLTASALAPSLARAGSDWKTVEAQYEVPVSEDLKEYAWFMVTDMKVREREGKKEIKYTLPLELTGRPVEIHLEGGIDDGGPYKGGTGRMDCVTPKDCEVRYDLELNGDEVRSHLMSRGIQGEELAKRMLVFEAFVDRDPAGIVHFQEPVRKRATSAIY